MAFYYVDSSALVKRYIRETGSAWVLSLFDPSLNNDVLIAAITGVEIIAAIIRYGAGKKYQHYRLDISVCSVQK